ncbi:MAG: hypothetical protein AAB489_04865 [Patescibacteria group bacterium]
MVLIIFSQKSSYKSSPSFARSDKKTVQWQIPFVPHEGKLYQIVVNSTYKSWLVSDVSDALFSITNCAEKRKSWKEPSARSKTQSELRRKKIVKCTSAEKRKSGTASPECEKKLKKTATKKKPPREKPSS